MELDLIAAGWATLVADVDGRQTIRLSSAGIRLLAEARRRNQRSLSTHDRLAAWVAAQLMAAGRIVWRELSVRARTTTSDPVAPGAASGIDQALWVDDEAIRQPQLPGQTSWRMARPDVFSVRRTSVEDYLQPMVHEVKVSRADLLSDLRHAVKRESYRWLSCESYYVLPADVAEPQEIPETFGVWLLRGPIDCGSLELARPARHAPCKLPFSVWMALAQATPVGADAEAVQQDLGDDTSVARSGTDGAANDGPLRKEDDA